MATKQKTITKSVALDKKTVSKKTPTKTTPKPAAKTAKATPVKVVNGVNKVSGKPTGVHKASKPKPNAGVKKVKKPQTVAAGRPSRAIPGAILGRPTKFKPEFTQMLIDYFDSKKKAYSLQIIKAGEGREKLEMVPEDFPTFEEFAADIGVSRETLHSWAADKDKDGQPLNPDFSDAYARARTRQSAILVKGSMAGAFEGRFAGLAAKNLIGWADKLEQTVDDVTGFSPEEKADLERSYNEAKLSGVWVKQRADMKARKQALNDD